MILDEIVTATRARVRSERAQLPLEHLQRAAAAPTADFAAALRAPGISFICEVKKASPSKGVIAADFPYLDIARDYEAAGAAAISVLTEPTFFQGSNDYLRDISGSVGLPCLRKDFIIDEYQIYQARQLGASAVLLIVAILHDCQLSDYLALTHRLGMAALVEVHDESELLRALAAGARIIGVNNRDLTTFTCDLAVTERLAPLVPADVLLVAESGITTAADVARMAAAGADAVLVGETLMRSADKTAALAELRGQLPVAGITRSAAPMLKICGLRRAADVAYVNEAYARYGTPEYAGFVFAPSKRQISPETAAGLRSDLDKRIKAVGVFVDQPLELIQQLVSAGTIELVQLHGGENQTYLDALRVLLGDVPVIKAVRMNEPGALEAALATSAEYLLLDSGAGSGETFDWAAVSAIDRPFFLAGGINIDNINAALTTLNPYAIDVSSGAETDGVKDAAKIAVLAQAVRGELA
ncbi:MAG: bifunctional indole-3-glycerol-phosphate synthase TrpC/phosphoribosylanthranilate isomerase TrpF [Propionibacteriaceae bacterium]|jgi:indole-3-glycerol phosphate synthase/phosphoribosylanthranilate isomerase|nr:bifunctional indole-3-glycerol-phosphate synthase TrpC/phosphoribosylanthranilate isomerase TrpF [Propionibacteriaceae bacterium]